MTTRGQVLISTSNSTGHIFNLYCEISNFDSISKRRIDSSISINQAYISLNQKKFNALNWYFDYLSEDQSEQSSRAMVVNELEQLCANLTSNNGQCDELLEKLNASEQQILKRVEWASGANPSLTETVKEFQAQRKQRNNYFLVSFHL